MVKTVSNRGIRLIYWAVSACFLVLAAWLYWEEGPYVKAMDIQVAPENGQIQVELLGDGKNVQVFSADSQVKLFADRCYDGRGDRLVIYGECPVERRKPVGVKVVSDSAHGDQQWNYQVLAGSLDGEIGFTTQENTGRRWYLWIALVAAMAGDILWFGKGKGKPWEELEVYSQTIIRKLGLEPGMGRCCEDGKRLFGVYERQKVFVLMLPVWLWVFWVFSMIRRGSHGMIPAGWMVSRLPVSFGAAMALMVWGIMRWGALTRQILIRDCRPVTAAVAYLLMGNWGIGKKRSRFLLYHNGASGLYRSGHCREALEISDMAWRMLPGKPGDYMAFVHCSLQFQCLQVLEEAEAAEAERQKMKGLLNKHPGWRRRRGIQRFLGIQDICQWIGTGEIERAEKSARQILGQWDEGYYRLPVLGLMAELKEFLGKEEEAHGLRDEILSFSPENKEVRQIMGKGRLSYREKKAAVWDLGLVAVYGICAAGIGACLLMM